MNIMTIGGLAVKVTSNITVWIWKTVGPVIWISGILTNVTDWIGIAISRRRGKSETVAVMHSLQCVRFKCTIDMALKTSRNNCRGHACQDHRTPGIETQNSFPADRAQYAADARGICGVEWKEINHTGYWKACLALKCVFLMSFAYSLISL